MAPGKWITDIAPETASIDGARRVLGLRLEALRDAVGCVAQNRNANHEGVHQLRVASRRASAALDIFKPCLGKKTFSTAAKRLRRLRRAAGEARDLDVFMMHYSAQLKQDSPDEAPTLDLLSGYMIAKRIPAQGQLEEVCKVYPFEFQKWMSETISSLIFPPREICRMHSLGKQYLGRLCDHIYDAMGSSSASYTELHDLRIVAKRLRYAMEVFVGCFATPFRDELYPRIAELQEILGVVNDAHVGLERTEALWNGLRSLLPSHSARWKDALESYIANMKLSRIQGREHFETWKTRVNHTGFKSLIVSLFGGSSNNSAITSYPFVKAS